ncbi:MAG TPA: agmatinase [Anaerohalosphaeraceae bacterium]|nr:agmatinase [Anaerohalosphaeraceae bacterium]
MTDRLEFGDFAPEFTRRDTSKVVIVPVPYDGTSTYIKGADRGPQAILEASPNLEFYDIQTDSEVFTEGIYTDDAVDGDWQGPEAMATAVRKRIAGLLGEGKFPVVLGGEHSVSIGVFEAMAERYPDLTILQLDAHSDLRDEYEGSKCNHACVMARARELCPIVQVGIRSMDVGEKPRMDKSRVFFAHDICDGADRGWIEKCVGMLSKHVYITIDLDVFDPSVLPATGTPEPGGMSWYGVMALMKTVFRARHVAGFDVVELCPRPEHWGSDFLAAKLVYALLTLKYRLK